MLLGGFCLENMATPINLNDVWRTSDGETWDQLAESGENRGLISSTRSTQFSSAKLISQLQNNSVLLFHEILMIENVCDYCYRVT